MNFRFADFFLKTGKFENFRTLLSSLLIFLSKSKTKGVFLCTSRQNPSKVRREPNFALLKTLQRRHFLASNHFKMDFNPQQVCETKRWESEDTFRYQQNSFWRCRSLRKTISKKISKTLFHMQNRCFWEARKCWVQPKNAQKLFFKISKNFF